MKKTFLALTLVLSFPMWAQGDGGGRFTFKTGLGGGQFEVKDNDSAVLQPETANLLVIDLQCGANFTKEFSMDAGLKLGLSGSMNTIRVDQNYLFDTSTKKDPIKLGFGYAYYNYDTQADYGFRQLLGLQAVLRFNMGALDIIYRGGPVINSSTSKLSNTIHILTAVLKFGKAQRTLGFTGEFEYLHFRSSTNDHLSTAQNFSVGMAYGFL